jgi:hypothetical protein
MKRNGYGVWTAAGLGALLGGGLIWALEEYVFAGGTPGILRDLIDWLAPLAGAAILGWLAARGKLPGQHPETPAGPPSAGDPAAGLARGHGMAALAGPAVVGR